MGRRQAREAALQALYQVDVGKVDPGQALANLAEMRGIAPEDLDFARELVTGTLAHVQALDLIISGLSRDWRLERMAVVDRNIMRLALFEIFHREDIPSSVSVNEAVELAKTFGGADSSRFINGILGRVVKEPDRYFPLKEEGV
ncbi:transcription antitermination factor NusB [Desulfofundulus thermobenzoicus]|uniref:Transcription antitermination protein NusB n=1 Tax=Desulfofundulus thermobenzoicus TaxID=29376 RepID=A0A6N7IQ38_9FIRM|nr:transcription antitermination factor NusB [Desulfofundulus thermobenzoicus]HHW42485.1 transcription antitermination factor NusB [Desulfotomaculum sp.]